MLSSFKTFPICINCFISLVPSPPLCSKCASVNCKNCERPWAQSNSVIEGYFSRYLLIGQCYRVLLAWKKCGGFLFDRILLGPLSPMNLGISSDNLERTVGRHFLVPIPQSYFRSWQLHCSPAQKVAKWVSRCTNILVRNLLLTRELNYRTVSQTIRQAQQNMSERAQVKEKFELNHPEVHLTLRRHHLSPSDISIILVDDFMTTGNTLRLAAQVLVHAGFTKIQAFTLGVRPFWVNQIQ